MELHHLLKKYFKPFYPGNNFAMFNKISYLKELLCRIKYQLYELS